jgi:hypothetical protein
VQPPAKGIRLLSLNLRGSWGLNVPGSQDLNVSLEFLLAGKKELQLPNGVALKANSLRHF